MRISDCDPSPQLPGCPTIVTRAEWKARPPKEPLTPLPKTPYYAFIHHGDSPPCFTKEECIRKVQAYQKFHMDTRGISCIVVCLVSKNASLLVLRHKTSHLSDFVFGSIQPA